MGKIHGARVEVHLIVEGHCVETEAKRIFNQLVNHLLRNDDLEKEKQLEILRKFLETANFNDLRRLGLDGRERKHVILKANPEGEIEIDVLE